jgi:hypothetical protein
VDWNARIGHRVGEPRAHVGQFGIDINTGFRIGRNMWDDQGVDGRYDEYETNKFVSD